VLIPVAYSCAQELILYMMIIYVRKNYMLISDCIRLLLQSQILRFMNYSLHCLLHRVLGMESLVHHEILRCNGDLTKVHDEAAKAMH
jgi:hypothetical protein